MSLLIALRLLCSHYSVKCNEYSDAFPFVAVLCCVSCNGRRYPGSL
jgi:hypothetical protein